MAEDFGDKTEAPTPRRRQEARDAGNIARSADLTAAALLISFLYLLNGFGAKLVGALRAVVADFLGAHSLASADPSTLQAPVYHAMMLVGLAMLPLLGGIILVVIAVSMAQVGLVFNLERLTPNLAALSPIRGWRRVFSFGGPGPVMLAMNLVKLLLVGWVAYSAVANRLPAILSVQKLEFLQIFGLGSSLIYTVALRLGILLFVLAVIDFAYQKFRIERELRMSKQEVKEEMRRMEGDPQIKGRRRQVAIQQHKQRLKKDVPKADVIVTNPTHFAVAIQYDQASMHAPKVVAKGQDHMAKLIREIAVAHGIPIIERPPLARAIYRLVDVGQELPEQFYAAIAEILAYVYELTGKLKQRRTA